jgi:glucosamine-phosphate N-acetyltransferase
MIIVRPAKIKDLSEIVKMKVRLLKYEASLDTYWTGKKNVKDTFYKIYKASINSKKNKLLVAEENNKIVGFGYASLIKNDILKTKVHGHINDMFVDKRYRRRGIAGKILQSFFEWFKKNGIKYAVLNVVSKNKIGYKAWTKYGFEDFVVRKRITFR